MRKPVSASAKKKVQIRCVVTPQLISTFVFTTMVVQYLFSKSEISSLFYGCTDRFMSHLAGNPEDRFSLNVAHISDIFYNKSDIYLNSDISYM